MAMDRRTRAARARLLVGTLALGLAWGCGGDDAPERSMVPKAAPTGTESAGSNRAPVVDRVAISPRRPMPGEELNAVVEAHDPDGHDVQLRYQWEVNRRPVSGGGARFTSDAGKDGRIAVTVVATDGRLESEPVRAEVRLGNQAPKVLGVTFDPAENVVPGDVLTALVDASDPDQDSLRLEYHWLVNGEDVRETGRTFETTRLRRGDRVQVRVRANDGDDTSGEITSPELLLGNRPPEIVGVPAPEREGDVFRYRFEARDPDGDRSLRFALGEAPAGMTIDPIYGVATWRPSHEQAGPQRIEVQVSDQQGDSTTLRFEVTVNSTEQPAAPAKQAP